MSHTVLRGKPNASQLHLDTLLDGARKSLCLENAIKERREVNLAELIYYSMKQRLDDVHMINGASGEQYTNRQILSRAVPLARALAQKYEAGTIIMFVMRNHEHMAVVYYASFFANVVPLPIEPNSTLHELRYFQTLVSPRIIFCDRDRYHDVKTTVDEMDSSQTTTVIISDDKPGFEDFCKGHSADMDSYRVSQTLPGSQVLLIPTSGSSGLPKATVLTHGGLVAQQPTLWTYSKIFPQPTKLALLLSTAQWLTHSTLMCSCPIHGVTLLMTPQKATVEHILEVLEKFQPTFVLLGPNFAKSLAASATPKQLTSLETVHTTGAPLTENIVKTLKTKLSKNTVIINGLGLTEMHGFITMPAPHMHWSSLGQILNIIIYKIISADGKELGVNEKGELYLKSDLCVFKNYYKNDEAYREVMTADGWFKTGDILYKDENEELYFVERKKFWFKYMNYHIAPEEVERVISSVQGVHECVVAETEKGPAAAVVIRAGYEQKYIKDEIHNTVNCSTIGGKSTEYWKTSVLGSQLHSAIISVCVEGLYSSLPCRAHTVEKSVEVNVKSL